MRRCLPALLLLTTLVLAACENTTDPKAEAAKAMNASAKKPPAEGTEPGAGSKKGP